MAKNKVDIEAGQTSPLDKEDDDDNNINGSVKTTEINVRVDQDCRICQLSLESSGIPIVLGCSCKDDLANAHKQCAEIWFKIRGNKICEICGSTAHNVGLVESEVVEQHNDADISTAAVATPTENRRFWRGHRFLNFLLACLIFAFVISWLFHFNVPG